MSVSSFARALAERSGIASEPRGKQWVYAPYDQLTLARGPLSRANPQETCVVLIESAQKPARRRYHKKKLAFLLSNERHFALELAERGFTVLYRAGEASFAEQLRDAMREHGQREAIVQRPAERELRKELASVEGLRTVSNELWLTTEEDFVRGCGEASPWRMDAFYRYVRRRTGVLMDDEGRPLGGRYSFDGENRERWRGDPPAPTAPTFEPDEITREVLALVERRWPGHFGTLAGFAMPCSRADAKALFDFVCAHCLKHFGPFEDAMSDEEPTLFHTQLSSLINVGRVLPSEVLDAAARALAEDRAPIQSVEGLVRQILGWREFVRHVHERTDGFRTIAPDGQPSELGAHEPLPKAFWDARETGLRCLDRTLETVWNTGYSHHITRLMVLSNIATLLGVEPKALSDWFWLAYTDAYDWVVEPNVLAMGTFGAGDVMTTKPYVSGAGYVHRMGDHCARCRFDPTGKDRARPCPLTPMYWAFLDRNLERLSKIDRVGPAILSARSRSDAQRQRDALILARVRERLAAGDALDASIASDPTVVPKKAVVRRKAK
ncbi:MAG: cryptochrome/photolyase family protein [Deltaproteobacteria bacterium]|nr:cryptochrome/photolyase family protein [Deltaproteobacteria bacterium]